MPRTGRDPARRVRLPPALRHVHRNAAGIDVGAGSHHVAIPPRRDPEGRDVREFGLTVLFPTLQPPGVWEALRPAVRSRSSRPASSSASFSATG